MAGKELRSRRSWFVRCNVVLQILSAKYVANSCGRAARGDDVGRERLAVLCRILLIVFQRERGLDEDDWTSEALNDFFLRTEAI